MKENRIPNIRFCPEVPDEECEGCKLACQGHPLLLSIDASYGYEEVYNKLCTKDCLKYKVPMNFDKDSGCYTLKNPDCIQVAMRCECIAETPKGMKYHPSLKALYERSGAKGKWVKTGYKCPKCGRYYGDNICKNCGHHIDWHRFLKSNRPDACLFGIKDKKGKEVYCPCNKYEKNPGVIV